MMSENPYFHISKIISKYLAGTLPASEQKQLDQWLSESAGHQELFEKWTSQATKTEKTEAYSRIQIEPAWEEFKSKRKKIIWQKRKKQIFRISKYAALLLLPLTLSWFLLRDDRSIPSPAISQPIEPGQPQALLTLSNGQQIILDRHNREIEDQGNTICTDSGKINYTPQNTTPKNQETYHKLEIPRGGEYFVTLGDGTKVWLNSETQLKFPVEFCGDTRKVYLTGEAFFKVTPDASRPFIVITEQARVTVLGTSFNVNSYQDNEIMLTTLEEGKVAVEATASGESLRIIPGEQVRIHRDGQMSKTKVDVTLFTSWKSGRLAFKDIHLDKLLQDLARWYDVNICFQKEKLRNISFTGDLKKYENLNEILEIIELTSEARFRIEGKSIVVY